MDLDDNEVACRSVAAQVPLRFHCASQELSICSTSILGVMGQRACLFERANKAPPFSPQQ